MCAVHVRIGHQHDLVIASLLQVELLGDTGADSGDQRLDLVVLQDLVDACLLDVQDLAADRKDGLRGAVARSLRRTSGRVSLHDVDLARRGVRELTVGELAGQRPRLQERLPPGQVSCLARGQPGLRGARGLREDPPRVRGVLFQPG